MTVLAEFSKVIRESHIAMNVIFAESNVIEFGVSDAGIIAKSKRVSCVLTVDLDLYLSIARAGYQVINFNHLRQKRIMGLGN